MCVAVFLQGIVAEKSVKAWLSLAWVGLRQESCSKGQSEVPPASKVLPSKKKPL